MDFSVLGPVEVRRDGVALPVGSGRERFVLASLLLNAGRLTSAGYLIDAMWPDPPKSARAQLHNMISKLRRRLCDGLIVSRPLGYELRLGPHRLDLLDFRRLVGAARQANADGDKAVAAAMLGEALALWRGPALADIAVDPMVGQRQALHDEFLGAAESKLDIYLELGRFAEVLEDLKSLLEGYPFRERLWQIRMTALVCAGRRADALETYHQARRRFVDELGVEPGPALRALEQRILRGEEPASVRRTGPVLPRQLPPAPGSLTGRDKVLDDIRAEFEARAPVVLLAGPGGVGKTAIALTVAHELRPAYPDGQLYANLRGSQAEPADPHRVTGRFLRAFGVGGSLLPDDPEERQALYRSHLAERKVLILLDDAASEEQVRRLLPGHPGCATIVTSRRRLGGLITATRWTVPVLDPGDAVELLARIVGVGRVESEPDAAARIVALCGRLPLAVSIAAARLALDPDRTLDEFHTMLSRQRQRLDELVLGDLDVRASIDLSYGSLDPGLRRFFGRLGLLGASDWPMWVAGELVPESTADVERMLDRLTDVHLIEPLGHDAVGQRRFRLHDLVAEYAQERAMQDEPDAQRAFDRVLSGWLALASEADERVGHGMMPASAGLAAPAPPRLAAIRAVRETPREWFETERPNLLATIESAARSGSASKAAELALRIAGYLQLRGYDDDWDWSLRTAADAARGHAPDEVFTRLLGALFAVALHRSRNRELPAIAAEELDLARRMGDRAREIGALGNAGWAARITGRLWDAEGWLKQALSICDDQTPTRLRTRAMHGLALVYREAGQSERALPLSQAALEIERPQGQPWITAICLVNCAAALIDLGRLDEAERALMEARQLTGSPDDLTITDHELSLADIEIGRGRWDAARRRLERALTFAESRHDYAYTAELLRALAEVATAGGRPDSAIAHLERALGLWRRLDVPLEAARIHARLERVLTATGDGAAAHDHRGEWKTVLSTLDLDERALRLRL